MTQFFDKKITDIDKEREAFEAEVKLPQWITYNADRNKYELADNAVNSHENYQIISSYNSEWKLWQVAIARAKQHSGEAVACIVSDDELLQAFKNTNIDKEHEAFEAHFPRPTKYKTLVEQLKLYEQWHDQRQGWQARAKQHSGEAVGNAFVQNGQIGFSIHNPNVKIKDGDLIYLSPQQPESVTEALEKVIDLIAYHEANDGDSGDFNITGLIKEIRNLINQPTQKDADKTLTKTHNWDKSGERCLDCGDKDWMQSPVCSGSKLRDK